MNHAQIRYLESKRSVDRRSRSRRVTDQLFGLLPSAPTIGEAGAGTGTTVSWLLDHGVTAGSYHGVDLSSMLVAHARQIQPAILRYRGYDAIDIDQGGIIGEFNFQFQTGEALELLQAKTHDLIIAQQFMDLVQLDRAVDALTTAVTAGGLLYCPLTFDGVTLFQPDHPDDYKIQQAYHDAINQDSGRNAQTGRQLLETFRTRPGSLRAVDASDAIVRPRDGEYPEDERYFLDQLLSFIQNSVSIKECPEVEEWLTTRRQQLTEAHLSYVGHRYDFLYQTTKND